jgi:translation initiation factor 3 subunit J
MADDWEDWEDEGLTPALPAVASVAAAAKPANAFEGEDEEEEEEEEEGGPAVPAPQPNKKAAAAAAAAAKYAGKGGSGSAKAASIDTPLDDPVAEKARRQRLVEEADLAAARELFGTALDLDGAKPPKGAAACEAWGRTVAAKYLVPHAANGQYVAMLKALVKAALDPLDAASAKEVEAGAAAVRSEKLKAEAAAKSAAARGGGGGAGAKKKTLNMGRSGGAAGLDDFVYEAAADDDYDFM